MTPTTNHELLESYISSLCADELMSYDDIIITLKEIQSRLIEPMEYEIGKRYQFSDDGISWDEEELASFETNMAFRDKIRPIIIPPEITSAISLLEQEGYIVTKK